VLDFTESTRGRESPAACSAVVADGCPRRLLGHVTVGVGCWRMSRSRRGWFDDVRCLCRRARARNVLVNGLVTSRRQKFLVHPHDILTRVELTGYAAANYFGS